jgi:hypothetical protein
MAARKRPRPKPKPHRYDVDYESRWLNFGGRLRWARKRMGARGQDYGAPDFARDLRPKLLETPYKHTAVLPNSVSRWEHDQQRPPLEVILVMADVLRVGPGWLAFGGWSHAPVPSWMTPEERAAPGPEMAARYGTRTDGKLRPSEYPHMVAGRKTEQPPGHARPAAGRQRTLG